LVLKKNSGKRTASVYFSITLALSGQVGSYRMR